MRNPLRLIEEERGRAGYLMLYMMGVPFGVLVLLWFFFGDNLIGRG